MKDKKHIEIEIQKTLDSFSDFERHEGSPFLLTRINVGIDEKLKGNTNPNFTLQSIFNIKPAFIVLILLFNIYTGTTYFLSQSESNYNRTEELVSHMDEYTLSSDSYDIDYEEMNY